MKKIAIAIFSIAVLALAAAAQEAGTNTTEAKAKPRIFRATKDQIKEVQAKLKTESLYTGEATGKLDDATRASIKNWQGSNGLKKTGTLNRATLEKMGIELTETQKQIPVSENSFASEEKAGSDAEKTGPKPKRVIFRATKDQISEAQRTLKAGNMYAGEETGKLDSATRVGLKKYQEANGLKVTGTLNQATLEKMGIELTEKQKADTAASPSK